MAGQQSRHKSRASEEHAGCHLQSSVKGDSRGNITSIEPFPRLPSKISPEQYRRYDRQTCGLNWNAPARNLNELLTLAGLAKEFDYSRTNTCSSRVLHPIALSYHQFG
jgi:hypothetical protein